MITEKEFKRQWDEVESSIKTVILTRDRGWISGKMYIIFTSYGKNRVEVSHYIDEQFVVTGLVDLSLVERVE